MRQVRVSKKNGAKQTAVDVNSRCDGSAFGIMSPEPRAISRAIAFAACEIRCNGIHGIARTVPMTAITAWFEKESHAIAKDWRHEDRGILRIKLADKGDRRSPFGLFLPLEGEPRRGDALGEYGDEARGGRYDCFAA